MSHLFFSEPAYLRAPAAPDRSEVDALWARYRDGEDVAGDIIQLHLRTAASVAHHWSNRRTFADTLSVALLALTRAVTRSRDVEIDGHPTAYLAQSMRLGVLQDRRNSSSEEAPVSLDDCSPNLPDFAAPPEHSDFEHDDLIEGITSCPRSQAILRLAQEGLPGEEISVKLGVSRPTVTRTLTKIRERLEVIYDERF